MKMNATLIILGMAVVFVMLTFVSILDAARRDFAEPYMKALWILISAIPVLGFIAWFSLGRKKSLPPSARTVPPE